MCGIFGLFGKNASSIPAPLDLLSHRGPDGRGEWRSADGSTLLAHTRLAIIDLSAAGAQPMEDAETGNVIVFNGEIYNHQHLREELAGAGIAWRGNSDTETILRAYAVLGREAVSRLKGMFAFILYDAKTRGIVAVRDRLGIKPLYLVRYAGGLALSSEVRPLQRFFPQQPTPATLSAYLSLGACPEEEILFPAVESVPAGHWLIAQSDGTTKLERYWRPGYRPQAAGVSAHRRVRELLDRSVQEHLLADVPVASFLSGGIDSSIVTALAAQHTAGPVATYSVGFAQARFDETSTALEVARRYRTQHTRIELSEPEVIELVRKAVALMDLPSVDAINTFVVSRAVADAGIKVALSGLGGDELFGGYPSFKDAPRLRRIARVPASVRRWLVTLGGATARRLADLPDTLDIATLAAWRRVFWTADRLRAAGLPLREYAVDQLAPEFDDFARISWAELSRYMRHLLLRDSDQMSMAASLELRVPFLDHDLVEYVLSLPADEKTRYGGVKGLLVESCRDLLPEAVYERPKMGFALPMDDWIRGPLAEFSAEGLRLAEAAGLLRRAALDDLQRDFRLRVLHWTRLWSVVVLGHYVSRRNQPTKDVAVFTR
jgi:asparagine synthase (glutamine-hydrolysing)